MSSTRHAVVRGPSFTGCGKRPAFTPAHHVDFDTGIGPRGARIEESRTKPVSGSVAWSDTARHRPDENGAVVRGSRAPVDEFVLRTGDFVQRRLSSCSFISASSKPKSSTASRRQSRTVSSERLSPTPAKVLEIAFAAELRRSLGR
jgi:hypothetical protein